MRKDERQRTILKLISENEIGRQEQLAGLLTDRGFSVTQASVSRDLDELGVVKLNGKYSLRPTGGRSASFGKVRINEAGDNLIVVRCASGLASAAAVLIDGAGISEIVGTIAGDDTIFVAVRDRHDQVRAVAAISRLLAEED